MLIFFMVLDDLSLIETSQTFILHFSLTFSCYLCFPIDIFSLSFHHQNHNLNFVFQYHTLLYFRLNSDFVFKSLLYYIDLAYMIIIDFLLIELVLLSLYFTYDHPAF